MMKSTTGDDGAGLGSPRECSVSVVTPTLGRAPEVRGLLENLAAQEVPLLELILVDASPDLETARVVDELASSLPFRVVYRRLGGGTAIQRNRGIDEAAGDLIATVDDDIRLEPDFFQETMRVFSEDQEERVGAVTGYITNQHLDPATSPRWKWYRRLKLFTTYEPGRYDYQTGYPINRYLQPPHDGLREIDFMGAGCAVWRRKAFDEGLRFSSFFTGIGVLEDAHLALRARRRWTLLENGRARCVHLRSQRSRTGFREIARRSAVSYRYVFVDIVPERTWNQEMRFWRVQLFDLFRFFVAALRRPRRETWQTVLGKVEGIFAAARLRTAEQDPSSEDATAVDHGSLER